MWRSKHENNKLEGLHQKPAQMERIRWEGQHFLEVVAPEEEEEKEEEEEEEEEERPIKKRIHNKHLSQRS